MFSSRCDLALVLPVIQITCMYQSLSGLIQQVVCIILTVNRTIDCLCPGSPIKQEALTNLLLLLLPCRGSQTRRSSLKPTCPPSLNDTSMTTRSRDRSAVRGWDTDRPRAAFRGIWSNTTVRMHRSLFHCNNRSQIQWIYFHEGK